MNNYRRIGVSESGDVSIVGFVDRKIIDTANIEELGDELIALVEKEKRKRLILNFSNVDFLSSAALNKVILLYKAVKAAAGKLCLCHLNNDMRQVLSITRLDILLDVRDDEADALATFK